MNSNPAATAPADAITIRDALRPKRSRSQRLLRMARSKPLGVVGLVLVAIVGLACLFAGAITDYNPTELAATPLQRPGGEHLMGTDDFGRDVFSRVLYGGRVSLRVGFLAVVIGVSAGTLVGLVSAYWGGWFDLIVQRLVDALMSFPTLVLALAIVAALGTSQRNVIIAVAIAMLPNVSRVVRSAVLGIREEQYIEAARSVGVGDRRIMQRHILPNIVGPLIIVATAYFGSAIVTEAALSFVGLGVPPPNPSWGNMMSGPARTYISVAWWMAFFPGLALSMLVFGINLFGDALRDLLDPRQRHR
jgi:peptide/nickel transport system permease protein